MSKLALLYHVMVTVVLMSVLLLTRTFAQEVKLAPCPTSTTVPLRTLTLTPLPSQYPYITQVDPRRTFETVEYNPVYQTATAYPTPTQEVWTVYKTLYSLNVRLSPNGTVVSGLVAGQKVMVVEVVKVGQDEWGKLENGYYAAILIGNKPYMVRQ